MDLDGHTTIPQEELGFRCKAMGTEFALQVMRMDGLNEAGRQFALAIVAREILTHACMMLSHQVTSQQISAGLCPWDEKEKVGNVDD